jgi:hypothetical protein
VFLYLKNPLSTRHYVCKQYSYIYSKYETYFMYSYTAHCPIPSFFEPLAMGVESKWRRLNLNFDWCDWRSLLTSSLFHQHIWTFEKHLTVFPVYLAGVRNTWVNAKDKSNAEGVHSDLAVEAGKVAIKYYSWADDSIKCSYTTQHQCHQRATLTPCKCNTPS